MGILKINKNVANNQTKVAERSVASLTKNVKAQNEEFVEELIALRTANETVYRRSDKTCRKIITSTPTRYRAENGEYKEIKSRLIDCGEEIINEENSFKVKFNKDVNNSKIFDLQKGKKSVSLSVGGSVKAHGHACSCKCELCLGKDNAVTAILDDGTEIEYVSLNDRIKEKMIIMVI